MSVFKKIQYILIYILGFVLIGITSLVSGDIGWAGFKEWKFYIDISLTYAAIICIIVATLFKIIDDFKSRNAEYKAADKEIKEFAVQTYIPSVFAKYCDHANKKRKLKQYVYNIKHKIYMLEQKATESDLHTWVNGTLEDKEKNSYCQKRLILEKQLTDEYIKKNLDTTKVSYDKISSTIILGGYYSKEDNLSANEFITKHKSVKLAKENTTRLLFGFAMTCFASSIVVSFSFNIAVIMPILVKIVILLFQALLTIRYANEWNETVTLKDIRFRKGIISEYNNWITQEYNRQQERLKNPNDAKAIVHDLEQDTVTNKNIQALQIAEYINQENLGEENTIKEI